MKVIQRRSHASGGYPRVFREAEAASASNEMVGVSAEVATVT